MSNRIFQNVVLQMKEGMDRTVGVIDAEGTVVACTDLALMGAQWPQVVEPISDAQNGMTAWEGKTFKALTAWGAQFDYAGFVNGEDAEAKTLCALATVALNGAKQSYEEKHDKGTFLKNIISDNILLGDIYVRAKELHLDCEEPRGVLLVRLAEESEPSVVEAIQALFPDRQADFALSVNDTDLAVVKRVAEGDDGRCLVAIARQVEELLTTELERKAVVGIGTVVNNIRDLARSYKEAQLAIEVG